MDAGQDDESGWRVRVHPAREPTEVQGPWEMYAGGGEGQHGQALFFNSRTGERPGQCAHRTADAALLPPGARRLREQRPAASPASGALQGDSPGSPYALLGRRGGSIEKPREIRASWETSTRPRHLLFPSDASRDLVGDPRGHRRQSFRLLRLR